MPEQAIQAGQSAAVAYLEDLSLLHSELGAAIEAIGANALPRFEDSVSRQQALCTHLQGLAERLAADQSGSAYVAGAGSNGDLVERILEASESLQELNLRYAALLAHSTDSVKLFAGLYRSYSANFPALAESGRVHGAWSCQL